MNEGHEYDERLGPDADGVLLIDYLARRHTHSTKSEWRARIEAGRVLLDTRPARPDQLLARGQTLVWRRPPWEEPEAPTSFAVLYEDAEILAVAKPAGLPTLPGGGFLESTLLHCVRKYDAEAAPLHRLGRWTSGLVLFARTRTARAGLTEQWVARRVCKRYRALASGRPASAELEIDTPIGPVPHALLGTVHGATPEGKPSHSHVRLVEQRDDAFLCDVTIATGRPHQIRIHLAAAGHPLVGDPLYAVGGLPLPGTHALPGDPGYHLHAAQLTFRRPSDGREITIECAPGTSVLRSRSTCSGAAPPR